MKSTQVKIKSSSPQLQQQSRKREHTVYANLEAWNIPRADTQISCYYQLACTKPVLISAKNIEQNSTDKHLITNNN